MKEYLNNIEYMECVKDILNSGIFQKLDGFVQHGCTCTMEHSIDALLHDFYLYDWHRPTKETGAFLHGFTHPYRAAKNAKKYFNITNKEASMIKTHMFPLTPIPPLSREGWVLTMADKSTSINEIIANMKNVHRAGEGTV